MFEEQEITTVEKEEMLERVQAVFEAGYRLVQMSCTRGKTYQIDYTFDKEYRFLDFRVYLPLDAPDLPSITGIYGCAFAYENEIHDLFGIRIQDISVDYQGRFYRIAAKSPFDNTGAPQAETPEEKE